MGQRPDATSRPCTRRTAATCSRRWSRRCASAGSASASTTRLIDWHHPHFPIDGLHPLRDDPQHWPASAGRDIAKYRELPARAGPRAAHQVTARSTTCGFDFSYPDHVHEGDAGVGRQGCGRLGTRGAAGHGPRAAARHHRQRPARPPGRLRHPRAVPASEPVLRDGRAGRLGGLPDDQRQLGLRPGQPGLQVAGPAGPDAGRHRLQGRQPAAQRRPDRPRRVRPAWLGGPWRRSASGCGCTAARSTAPGRASSPRRRTAATPSAATGSTCTCSPGRSSTVHLPGLAGHVDYAQLLHDASEVALETHDHARAATMTDEPAQPPGTLTLRLPVRRPDEEIPVVELFLREPGARQPGPVEDRQA